MMKEYNIEKTCHACIGVWFQIKEEGNKKPIFRSKKRKDCIEYIKQNKDE